ncbi:Uricase [Beijerinckiaceae bacterium RH AL1]|nr:urate oxidase [Beijerinckiaceae bacterium]VVB44575.1 Uricase [Beijerinckiaceae bacterium RH CH11]VVB44654.1 Uricase [Beijerinckiaceae bacterium RH AL8]VVC54427.1 Uricase [Beijerinckiaceae bacterium RH AL1]
MTLVMNRYGKGRVRVMRLTRDTPRHEPRELTVEAIIEGDFGRAYTAADNSTSVSTDTTKNLINVVAHDNLDLPTELFCKAVTERFFRDYPQVEKCTVTAKETKWTRLVIDGKEHPHSFTLDSNGKPFAVVIATRAGLKTVSGIEGFTILKTTDSGWANFYQDPLTTILPATDRMASTSLVASWDWTRAPADYPAANTKILDAMVEVFATTYSNSMQDSLYRMGTAALEAVPEIATVSLAAPNKHYLPMNLAVFDRPFDGTLFLPTDEPHGQIECTVGRG